MPSNLKKFISTSRDILRPISFQSTSDDCRKTHNFFSSLQENLVEAVKHITCSLKTLDMFENKCKETKKQKLKLMIKTYVQVKKMKCLILKARKTLPET